ncbi:unnamed protein product, partial [Didymodactylos carnosus]
EEPDDFDRRTPKTIRSTTVTTNGTLPNDDLTCGLRSKDLRSVIEKKRLNFSRSRSSSDSEGDGNDNGKNKQRRISPTNRPTSFQDNDTHTNHPQHRGRSLSNVENVINSGLVITSTDQTTPSTNSQFADAKRRSFSRASSVASNNRLTLNGDSVDGSNNDNNMNILSTSISTDRTRSLSIEHRLANPSQMSIASRTSVRFSTPRESTVFTKTDAPPVIRLLQSQAHDNESLRSFIEHQRQQSTPSHQEHTPIIEEEATLKTSVVDNTIPATTTTTTSPVNSVSPTIKVPATKKNSNHNGSGNSTILHSTKSNAIVPTTIVNGHINNNQDHSSSSSSPQQSSSVLCALRQSLINHKHHNQQKSDTNIKQSSNDGDKIKRHHSSDYITSTTSTLNAKKTSLINDDSSTKRRVCCTIL